MSKPKKIRDYKECSIDYCSGSLETIFEILTEKFKILVPEEYRDKALVEIKAIGDYDDGHEAMLGVSFDRMETPKEVEERIIREEDQRQYKRNLLAQLKKELGE